jgi:hypothetical protein
MPKLLHKYPQLLGDFLFMLCHIIDVKGFMERAGDG